MTTPLMLVLSSITPTLGYDHPVDTMYLNRNDRAFLLREVARFGKLIADDTTIITTRDAFDDEVCDTVQVINGTVKDISQATAVILTRFKKCYEVFKTSSQAAEDDSVRDLDTDAVILKLEGNPRYIYSYVYNMMENTALDYDARVLRLAELYNALNGFTSGVSISDKQSFLIGRFQAMGELAFWQRLIYFDWMHQTLSMPEPVTMATLKQVREELLSMGFYGFVNPWAMYTEFSNSRVNRKVELRIADDVISFLRKIVLSGGVQVQ